MDIRKKHKILWLFVIIFGAISLLTSCNNKMDPTTTTNTTQASNVENTIDYTNYSDEQFISKVNCWQNKDVPGVIWIFNDDGTGQITADNNRHVYDITWRYEDEEDILSFTIEDWSYVNDKQAFTIKIDKENILFESYNVDTDSVAVFVPQGTVPFPSYDNNKPDELLGAWLKVSSNQDDFAIRVWYLTANDERSGYGVYFKDENRLFIEHYFDDWNVIAPNDLVFVFENGTESWYKYIIDDDTISFSDDDSNQYQFVRLDLSGVEIVK